jgi:hypothetical protein
MTGFQIIHHDGKHTPIVDGKAGQQRRVEAHKCADQDRQQENEISPLRATNWFHRQILHE